MNLTENFKNHTPKLKCISYENTVSTKMLELLPNDIFIDILSYLFPLDLVNIKISCKHFNTQIEFLGKIDDSDEDITHISCAVSLRKRCDICGYIYPRDIPKLCPFHRGLPSCQVIPDINHYTIYQLNPFSEKIRREQFSLLSLYDSDCLLGNCNCESKIYLTKKKNLIEDWRNTRITFILETDYGYTEFHPSSYIHYAPQFYQETIYTPDKAWKKEYPEGFLRPNILQTSTHHWIILKYSNKIIPIKKIITY